MNRVTAVATPGGTSDLTYTYAPDGLVTQVTANNPGNATVTTTYAYYKRRLLQQETVSQPSASFTLGYSYTGNGHLSTLTYPDNQVVAYAPNALGQATKVGSYATGVTYYPNGAIKQFSYGNGVLHTMTQNARRLPARSRDAGATVVLDDSYDFDANGNVTDITDQAQAGLTTRGMAYDGLDRLTTVVAPGLWGNATYGYDALDNLRKADQGTRQYRYVYDAQLRLSQITNPAGTPQITLGYDVRGNITSKNSQAFVFDASNRLNQVTGQETYRYDGQGRRVQATMPDTKSMFWQYSQAGQVMYVSDTRRSRNTAYLYLGNSLVAMRHEAWGTGTVTVSYQHTDALGSPVAETDAGGAVTQRYTYAPYGEAYNSSIDGPGYTGHVMDQATGLTYMQQRYYDPQIGRFLSVDPVEADADTGDDFNRYAYAYNNPYSFTDPDGRKPEDREDPPPPPPPPTTLPPVTVTAPPPPPPIILATVVVTAPQPMPLEIPRIPRIPWLAIGEGLLSRLPVTLPLMVAWPSPLGAAACEMSGAPPCGATVYQAAEHTKGARPSTRGKHEKGKARAKTDKHGGEKGDNNRDPYGKRPPGHKGPWPPKD